MLKIILTSLALAVISISPTLAQSNQDTAEGGACMQSALELAKTAETKSLPNAKVEKLEAMLAVMEGHCAAKQQAQADSVADEIKALIATGP
jgi:hypothetical protein